jgi:transcriptional regulator with XRE-family HTH domain
MSGSATPVDPATAGPTVPRILLGLHLRRLREARGISARDAAQAIRGSESKISRIELGRNAVREVDVMDLLSLYEVADDAERDWLLSLASQANQEAWWHSYKDVLPAWFQPYIGLEECAESIRSYDTQVVPGLLQTEDYAAALIRLSPAFSARQAAQRIGVRMQRQQLLADGLRLLAIIDEAALRRSVGSTRLMHDQLEHLLAMCDRPGLNIQVTPLSTTASYAAPCSFSLLHFAADELPDMVYIEQLTSALYLEKPVEVERYATVLDQVSSASTTADQTTDFIQAILAELDPQA